MNRTALLAALLALALFCGCSATPDSGDSCYPGASPECRGLITGAGG